ncbi:hypothetical protein DAT35_19240 [Vitiosangium sp. GDMCC 1.1324]|nr:hypothetical protein DAT35_19240 [Vitiosangium sp. GDMCC 1.1324]
MAAAAALLVMAGCEKREAREQQRETVAAPEQSEPGTTSQGRAAAPPGARQQSARQQPKPPEPQAQPKPDEAGASATQSQQVSGEVLSFAENELHVLSGSNDVRMLVTQGTEVRVNGRPATAADIREGGEVRATYKYAEGQPVALVVELQRPEGTAPPASDEAQQPESLPERVPHEKSQD